MLRLPDASLSAHHEPTLGCLDSLGGRCLLAVCPAMALSIKV